MAKLKQSSKQWETPQITSKQSATTFRGGEAPSKDDIIESANARAQKRHEMKNAALADMGVLPDSSELVGDERVGIRDHGYLVKKNLEFGASAMYNSLPPGMDIEDQELADIREMELRVFDRGLGYPGDGWTHRTRGSQMPSTVDTGRNENTNDMGSTDLNPPEVT